MPEEKNKTKSVEAQALEDCKNFYDTYSPLLTKTKKN